MLKKFAQRFRSTSTTPSKMTGFTLPDLLKASCEEFPNHSMFFQFRGSKWQPYTNQDLNVQVNDAALGLQALGLNQGDRVGFLLNSDFNFLAADLACATANLVSVPIDLSQTIENIIFSLQHSEARVLFVVNHSLLGQILPYLNQVHDLRWIVVFQPRKNSTPAATTAQSTPESTKERPIPPSIGLELDTTQLDRDTDQFLTPFTLLSWNDLMHLGQAKQATAPDALNQSVQAHTPQDLATIIYIPDETGHLQGVMLSHENLTSTALASFAGMTGVRKGERESAVTFLPLTHIFARMMLYGHLYYSHKIYFSTPRRVMKHLVEVKPTILTTVPLLLHRVYRRLKSYGKENTHAKARKHQHNQWVRTFSFNRIKLTTHQWAMAIAQHHSQIEETLGLSQLEQKLAAPVFHQWRKIFGGRIRYCLSGGAALDKDVARFFIRIGFPLYQGYGLTQTSSTVTFNHPHRNFPGTVGQVRAGVECAIAQDGEVLVKGTGNLMGYFKKSDAIEIDEEGWFHTGDLGYLDAKHNLTLVGSKKNLFKLTTGKYVTPIPLEATLRESPLIRHALVIGEEKKYCAALVFVEPSALQQQAKKMGLVHYALDALLENPCIQALYQSLIDEANCHFPYWSTIKKIYLLPASAYPSNLRSYALSTVRRRLVQRFATVIEQLYHESSERRKLNPAATEDCRDIPLVACPVAAQSLKTSVS